MPKVIQINVLQQQRETQAIAVRRYSEFPTWVWPFECELCGHDLDKDGVQVIAELDGGRLLHAHPSCWHKEVTDA